MDEIQSDEITKAKEIIKKNMLENKFLKSELETFIKEEQRARRLSIKDLYMLKSFFERFKTWSEKNKEVFK